MEVMKDHKWHDQDVKWVAQGGLGLALEHRAIMFTELVKYLIVNKQDAIALAKEFGLVVYEKGAEL